MSKLKKLTSMRLFLPIFCMLLVLAINVVYDIIQGNAFYDFFTISIQNGVLYGRLITVLNRGSEVAILAIGMTLVVSSSAGTDISVGSVMSLCASFCCMLVAGFGVTTPIIIAAVCVVVTYIVLKKTALGMYIQSVGINKKASRIAGLNSRRIIFLCYVICGLCAGIAGIIASSRITSADSNNIGLNFEMDAILAVALGGNSLGGGKFNLLGSIIGAYTIQAITTTMYAMGVSTAQAPVFKAIVIIIIVAIQAPVQAWFQKHRAKRLERTGKEAVGV